MPKENNDSDIWKYFKNGDIIQDSKNSVWGNKLFEIYYFHGNSYSPLVSAFMIDKPKSNENRFNFDIREIRLISSRVRPFGKLEKSVLIKLMQKNNIEAKREMIMRINAKK